MYDESPYNSSMIKPIRPPEVEGSAGDWRSRWLLRLRSTPPDAARLRSVCAEMEKIEGVREVMLTTLGTVELRLEICSVAHPFDPEAFLLIDAMLLRINKEIGEISDINDSPRDWWRTFRSNRPPTS